MNTVVDNGLAPGPESYSAAPLIEALRRILPAHCVLFREEDTRPYECDGLPLYRCLPAAVVLPENEAQVCEVLKLCKRMNVPLVPRGAGTGLSGGALPHGRGVLIGLSKLNRIKRIDREACVAVVEPGVRNLAISEAAAPYGLYYAPDPSSQIACSIGGNVAENSGGVHCLKYGLTVHNVLRVRMVTIEGDVVELGSEAPDAPGPDLLSVFVGSEGMLGIVTEVTVKLVPKPACAQVVMASFPSVEAAGRAGGRDPRSAAAKSRAQASRAGGVVPQQTRQRASCPRVGRGGRSPASGQECRRCREDRRGARTRRPPITRRPRPSRHRVSAHIGRRPAHAV